MMLNGTCFVPKFRRTFRFAGSLVSPEVSFRWGFSRLIRKSRFVRNFPFHFVGSLLSSQVSFSCVFGQQLCSSGFQKRGVVLKILRRSFVQVGESMVAASGYAPNRSLYRPLYTALLCIAPCSFYAVMLCIYALSTHSGKKRQGLIK